MRVEVVVFVLAQLAAQVVQRVARPAAALAVVACIAAVADALAVVAAAAGWARLSLCWAVVPTAAPSICIAGTAGQPKAGGFVGYIAALVAGADPTAAAAQFARVLAAVAAVARSGRRARASRLAHQSATTAVSCQKGARPVAATEAVTEAVYRSLKQ